ncbi:probable protein phosphatase 2C 34 isoform X1 [Zingiber officinale]|uniref:probable protein phosphatase 2C 34 isoform X1 n=1 Tax=Zingiber officinale TaxID=94328 RepID=UPI001C4B6C70|nr:probable protein phosphatase 2C 34 isoform X1 [Zingiber officinale]
MKVGSLWKSLLCTGKRRVSEADPGREAADDLRREAKKKSMILRSSGSLPSPCSRSSAFASVFSQRGEKGMNQDCCLVWQEFGCQEDMAFCGVFDGHGPWGYHVASAVRRALPSSLLCNWQEALAKVDDEKLCHFDLWNRSFLLACDAVDKELQLDRTLSFHSGTTALTIVKQGNLIVIANVGDSRAVLATVNENGGLSPVQLSVDLKPNLPQELERITQRRGRVHCCADEPGVHRVWLPTEEAPGLAMSRAFGDYCVKDFGVISEPQVTQRIITNKDRFVVLATDGVIQTHAVWDVISNEEAIRIVSASKDPRRSAKRLVGCAVRAWRRKRRGYAVDDCSAICLFLHP